LERKVEEFIDRFLDRDRYLFRLKFFEFTRTLLNTLDLRALAQAAVEFISQALVVDIIGLWVIDEEKNAYYLISAQRKFGEKNFSLDSPLIAFLQKTSRVVELAPLKEYAHLRPEAQELIEKGFFMAIPFPWEEGLLGFLLLGEKRNGKSFSIMEIEALEALAPATAMAISRALLYQNLKKKDWQMMQSEKLAALGEMAASFVHGIRNPLGIILGAAETLQKNLSPAIQKEMIQFIREEGERINQMLANFLEFAKPKPPAFKETNLQEILRKTVELISIPAKQRGINIVQEYPPEEISLYLDPEQIKEALLNLEINALEAMPQGGVLRLVLAKKDDQEVIIRVSDTGQGISPQIKSKIFDPFFTTKEQGTGLGLTIVHLVVKNHGGTISVAPNNGQGTTFTITLPRLKGLKGCFGPLGPIK
jgi:signal transduction histidine kinase